MSIMFSRRHRRRALECYVPGPTTSDWLRVWRIIEVLLCCTVLYGEHIALVGGHFMGVHCTQCRIVYASNQCCGGGGFVGCLAYVVCVRDFGMYALASSITAHKMKWLLYTAPCVSISYVCVLWLKHILYLLCIQTSAHRREVWMTDARRIYQSHDSDSTRTLFSAINL